MNPPQTLWQLPVTTGAEHVAATANTVVMVRSGSDDVLSGIDPATGAERWTWATPDTTLIYRMVLDQNTLYVATESRIYAIDADRRKQLWHAELPAGLRSVEQGRGGMDHGRPGPAPTRDRPAREQILAGRISLAALCGLGR